MSISKFKKAALILTILCALVSGTAGIAGAETNSTSEDESHHSSETTETSSTSSDTEEEKKEVTREEKAVEATRTTTQIITTRVMAVFTPKPAAVRTPAPAPTPQQPDVNGANSMNGLSSGDGFSKFGIGVWGLGAYSDTGVNKSGYKSDSNIGIAMLGMDKLFYDDRIAVGIAAGYEDSWSRLKANGYTEDGTGFSVTPYAAFRVTDAFTVKGLFSSTFTDYDASGNTQDYSGTRLVGDISADYTWIIGAISATAEAGFMYMNEDYNHNNVDTYLGEGRLSGRLGYSFDFGLEPYFRGTFYQGLIENNNAHFENHLWEGAVGMNYYLDSFSFSAEGFGSTNQDKDTVGGSLLVRFDF